MDVGFDQALAENENALISTISWDITVGNYPLRTLLVGVTTDGDTVTDADLDSESLSSLENGAIGSVRVEWWYLHSPPIGSGQTLTVNLSGTCYGSAGAMSLYGVDIGAGASAFSARVEGGYNGSSAGMSASVPSASTDEMVVFHGGKAGDGGYGLTVMSGSTQAYNQWNTGTGSLGDRRYASGCYENGSGTVVLGFDWTTHSTTYQYMGMRVLPGGLSASGVMMMGIRRMRDIYQQLMNGLIPGHDLQKAWDWVKGADLVDRSGWKAKELPWQFA